MFLSCPSWVGWSRVPFAEIVLVFACCPEAVSNRAPFYSQKLSTGEALLALAHANLGMWTKCFHFVGFSSVTGSRLLAEISRLGLRFTWQGRSACGVLTPGSESHSYSEEEISFCSENKSGSLEHILHFQVFLLCKWANYPCCLCSLKSLPTVIQKLISCSDMLKSLNRVCKGERSA